MKTQGMAHQLEALRHSNGREWFAFLMEMGTGKTWTALADAERAYNAGLIDAVLVIAPKGVHTNWIRIEIPTHLSAKHIAAAYVSGASKAQLAKVNKLFLPRAHGEQVPLRIMAINIDAVNTAKGLDVALRFLNCTKAMVIVDESDTIKSPSASRTQRVLRLGHHAVMRRICSGSPITNAPLDIFTQMEFLCSGLLGTTSYRAFVAEYADLLPQNNRLVMEIKRKAGPRAAHTNPQIVARNPDGTKRWRNLERLQTLIAPHAYRKLKRDCLDLPEKIYKRRFFELTPTQRRVYDTLKNELRVVLEDGEINTVAALAALMKLQQVTSGYVNLDGAPVLLPATDNPRMTLLKELAEGIHGKIIVWARFREELRQIAAELASHGVVEYHGGTNNKDRERAIDEFQSGRARIFVSNPATGGTGITLTAAECAIYYSNDFSLRNRIQSEDRAHRIGTKRNVVYIDLTAQNTIDEAIVAALRSKKEIADLILGDDRAAVWSGSDDN